MQQQPQNAFDFHRVLVGMDTPWWFLLEQLVRIVCIYLLLMVVMRLMGRRVAAQMTIAELAVVVTLGAAVGVPMQSPERGMLPAAVILLVALIFQRGLSWLAVRNRRVEVIAEGEAIMIVADGRMLLDAMARMVLSRERLFAKLRGMGVEHLGEVRRVYVESSGDFSLYRLQHAQPGLSILPTFDHDLRSDARAVADHHACASCGNVGAARRRPTEPCPCCGAQAWTPAVTEIERATADRRRAAESAAPARDAHAS
jgi:uncharacterized membrane protein YcaP (DUF421 family)